MRSDVHAYGIGRWDLILSVTLTRSGSYDERIQVHGTYDQVHLNIKTMLTHLLIIG